MVGSRLWSGDGWWGGGRRGVSERVQDSSETMGENGGRGEWATLLVLGMGILSRKENNKSNYLELSITWAHLVTSRLFII